MSRLYGARREAAPLVAAPVSAPPQKAPRPWSRLGGLLELSQVGSHY